MKFWEIYKQNALIWKMFLDKSEFCHNLIGTIIRDLVLQLGIVWHKTKKNTFMS